MSIQDIKLASGSKLNDKSNINPNKTKYCRFIQAKKVEVPDIVMAIHPHLEGEFWGPTVDLLLDENVVTGNKLKFRFLSTFCSSQHSRHSMRSTSSKPSSDWTTYLLNIFSR